MAEAEEELVGGPAVAKDLPTTSVYNMHENFLFSCHNGTDSLCLVSATLLRWIYVKPQGEQRPQVL